MNDLGLLELISAKALTPNSQLLTLNFILTNFGGLSPCMYRQRELNA
jgi:hypothetical protein